MKHKDLIIGIILILMSMFIGLPIKGGIVSIIIALIFFYMGSMYIIEWYEDL